MSIHAFGPVLLCITFLSLIVFLCFLGFRQSKRKKDPLEQVLLSLLRSDSRTAYIVSQLSWLHDLKSAASVRPPLSRKKMKLILELRARVRRHYPNAPREHVNYLCKRLLLIAQSVSDKRQSRE